MSGQPPNNNPQSAAARSRANVCARDIRPDLIGSAIEADGNLIPRGGRSSIAGPNRVREVAELNFEGSYISTDIFIYIYTVAVARARR